MIFTNISYIGDFFLLWPVASWYYKETGDKIHWVVTKNYYMYPLVEEVLRYQDFTKDVSLVDVGTNAWDENQWKFNPATFGIEGQYMNFGFNNNLGEMYMPDFYASLYNLKQDSDYCIKLIDFPDRTPHEKVTMYIKHQAGRWPIWRNLMPEDVVELDYINDSFAVNLWYSAKAQERYFGCSSSAVLMDLINLPCTIFFGQIVPADGDKSYYRNKFHTMIGA